VHIHIHIANTSDLFAVLLGNITLATTEDFENAGVVGKQAAVAKEKGSQALEKVQQVINTSEIALNRLKGQKLATEVARNIKKALPGLESARKQLQKSITAVPIDASMVKDAITKAMAAMETQVESLKYAAKFFG